MPQSKYEYRSPRTNRSYSFDWDKPGEPTDSDFSALQKYIEDMENQELGAPQLPTRSPGASGWAMGHVPAPANVPDITYPISDYVRKLGEIGHSLLTSSEAQQWAYATQELNRRNSLTPEQKAYQDKADADNFRMGLEHRNTSPLGIATSAAGIIDPTGMLPSTLEIGGSAVGHASRGEWPEAAAEFTALTAPLWLHGLNRKAAPNLIPESRRLPAIGETGYGNNPPRFYQGVAGVADATLEHQGWVPGSMGRPSNDIGALIAAGRERALVDPVTGEVGPTVPWITPRGEIKPTLNPGRNEIVYPEVPPVDEWGRSTTPVRGEVYGPPPMRTEPIPTLGEFEGATSKWPRNYIENPLPQVPRPPRTTTEPFPVSRDRLPSDAGVVDFTEIMEGLTDAARKIRNGFLAIYKDVNGKTILHPKAFTTKEEATSASPGAVAVRVTNGNVEQPTGTGRFGAIESPVGELPSVTREPELESRHEAFDSGRIPLDREAVIERFGDVDEALNKGIIVRDPAGGYRENPDYVPSMFRGRELPPVNRPSEVNRPRELTSTDEQLSRNIPKTGNIEFDNTLSKYQALETKAFREGLSEVETNEFSRLGDILENHPSMPPEVKAAWNRIKSRPVELPPVGTNMVPRELPEIIRDVTGKADLHLREIQPEPERIRASDASRYRDEIVNKLEEAKRSGDTRRIRIYQDLADKAVKDYTESLKRLPENQPEPYHRIFEQDELDKIEKEILDTTDERKAYDNFQYLDKKLKNVRRVGNPDELEQAGFLRDTALDRYRELTLGRDALVEGGEFAKPPRLEPEYSRETTTSKRVGPTGQPSPKKKAITAEEILAETGKLPSDAGVVDLGRRPKKSSGSPPPTVKTTPTTPPKGGVPFQEIFERLVKTRQSTNWMKDPVAAKAERVRAIKEFIQDSIDNGHLTETGRRPANAPKIPSDWKTVHPDFLKGPTQGNLMGPKEIVKKIENYLKPDEGWLAKAGEISSKSKSVALSSGFFPGKPIATSQGINTLRMAMAEGGFGRLKQAVDFGINPKKAGQLLDAERNQIIQAIKEDGLMLGNDDAALAGKRVFANATNKFTKGVNKITEWQHKLFEEPLFNKMIPATKWQAYKAIKAKNLEMGIPNAGKVAAETVNNFYGGINYELLGRNKNFQNTMRTLFLAPDWLESRIKGGWAAAKELGSVPTGKLNKNPVYLKAAGRLLATYVAADVLQKLLTGDYMHDNEGNKKFAFKFGKTSNGKDRYIDPFGTSVDFVKAPLNALFTAKEGQGPLASTEDIAEGKLGLLSRIILDHLKGEDLQGRPNITGKNDVFEKDSDWLNKIGNSLESIEQFFPSYLRGPIEYGTGSKGFEEALTGATEMPVRYGYPKKGKPVVTLPKVSPPPRPRPGR